MLKLFCLHRKRSAIDERGYQYCAECGKAFPAPSQAPPPPCPHGKKLNLEKIVITGKFTGNVKRFVYVQQCEQCGTLFNHYVTPEKGMDIFNSAEDAE